MKPRDYDSMWNKCACFYNQILIMHKLLCLQHISVPCALLIYVKQQMVFPIKGQAETTGAITRLYYLQCNGAMLCFASELTIETTFVSLVMHIGIP